MSKYENPKLVIETRKISEGRVAWRSPSNLAIVKYWGKHGRQLPKNPSVSMTLSESHTETRVGYTPKKGVDSGLSLAFYFEGKKNISFEKRISSYLEALLPIFPFLKQLELRIDSRNSFPHSSGIASSASSMSALALALCSLEQEFFESLDEEAFYRKASYVARLGSGSACRSVYPHYAWWGKFAALDQGSDEYAVPFETETHPVFHTLKDSICIVSRKEKPVSSSAGHQLMDQNPFAPTRYEVAKKQLLQLISIFKKGDLEAFGKIVEAEALQLHALMMCSNPPYILLESGTLGIIQQIWSYRRETGTPVYFSLDAGPNVHLLYPAETEDAVRSFIDTNIAPLCEENQIIHDACGAGPKKLTNADHQA